MESFLQRISQISNILQKNTYLIFKTNDLLLSLIKVLFVEIIILLGPNNKHHHFQTLIIIIILDIPLMKHG